MDILVVRLRQEYFNFELPSVTIEYEAFEFWLKFTATL